MNSSFEIELNKQHQIQMRREAEILNQLPRATSTLAKALGSTLIQIGQRLQGSNLQKST